MDVNEIRQRCKNSIANTRVGRYLGEALEEVERLRAENAVLSARLLNTLADGG